MTQEISVDNLSVKKQSVLKALREGNSRTAAAELSGVGRRTFYWWLQNDSVFSEAVTAAEAEAEVQCVNVVLSAAQGGNILKRCAIVKPDGTTSIVEHYAAPDWRSAAWWLERRRRWLTTPNPPINLEELSEAQLIGILESEESRGADDGAE